MDNLENIISQTEFNNCLEFEKDLLKYVPKHKRLDFVNEYGSIMRDMFNKYIKQGEYNYGKKETENYKQKKLF